MKCWLLAISHPTSVSLALTVNPTPDLYAKETGAQTAACITAAWRRRRVNTQILPGSCFPKAIMLLISAVLEGAGVATTPGYAASQANGSVCVNLLLLLRAQQPGEGGSATHKLTLCHLTPVPLAFVILIPRNEQRCGGGILPSSPGPLTTQGEGRAVCLPALPR